MQNMHRTQICESKHIKINNGITISAIQIWTHMYLNKLNSCTQNKHNKHTLSCVINTCIQKNNRFFEALVLLAFAVIVLSDRRTPTTTTTCTHKIYMYTYKYSYNCLCIRVLYV